MTFNSDEHYTPDDPALRIIATIGTLAVWRCQRRGPKFYKFGKRILYLGSDLNDWCAARLVDTSAA